MMSRCKCMLEDDADSSPYLGLRRALDEIGPAPRKVDVHSGLKDSRNRRGGSSTNRPPARPYACIDLCGNGSCSLDGRKVGIDRHVPTGRPVSRKGGDASARPHVQSSLGGNPLKPG